MFSWSTGRQRGNGHSHSVTDSYPGNRTHTNTTGVATVIRGSIRPPDYSRKQHLDSYIENDMLRRSTRRVSSDDSTYDTVFSTVSRSTLILRVHFPADNSRAPVMTLAGCSATHPWLDHQMKVVGYRPIQSDQQWKDSRMLLGVAVQEVVQHFQVQPPAIQQIFDSNLRNIQPNNNPDSSTPPPPAKRSHYHHHHSASSSSSMDDAPPDYDTLLQASPVPQETTSRKVDVPSVPVEFSKLESMEREELEKLLKDHIALVAFCNELPYIKELNEKRVSVLEENVKKAQSNMEKREELHSLHSEVKELQKNFKSKVKEFKQLEEKQDSMCAVPDTRVILKELHRAKKEAFEESEQLAEEWLDDGAADVKDFCRRFIEARKVHHVRAGKMEILQRQDGGC